MNETKSVKALKKQLAAAIAMVCVAAVALGSSTYAWFVSNNTVKGTTTNISAQSNAAFMVIDKTVTNDLYCYCRSGSKADSSAIFIYL